MCLGPLRHEHYKEIKRKCPARSRSKFYFPPTKQLDGKIYTGREGQEYWSAPRSPPLEDLLSIFVLVQQAKIPYLPSARGIYPYARCFRLSVCCLQCCDSCRLVTRVLLARILGVSRSGASVEGVADLFLVVETLVVIL